VILDLEMPVLNGFDTCSDQACAQSRPTTDHRRLRFARLYQGRRRRKHFRPRSSEATRL
jgi:hypothetical protein